MDLFIPYANVLCFVRIFVLWKALGGVKKIKTLLVPFIEFRIILVLYWFIVESSFRELDVGPIWFLLSLFFVYEITFPLCAIKRKKSFLLFVWLIIFMVIFHVGKYLHFYDSILIWINSSIWFIIGMIVKLILSNSVSRKHFANASRYLIIPLIIISLLSPFLNGKVSIYSNETNNFILYILNGIIGSFLVYVISSQLVVSNRTIEYLGRYSIIILAFHEPIKRVLIYVTQKICGYFDLIIYKDYFSDHYWAGFVLSIIVALSCIPIIELLRMLKNKYKLFDAILPYIK